MRIHNGDHAEFEIQHANTPLKDRPDWPLPSFDARDWAEAFCQRFPAVPQDDAVAWFANALMRGYDQRPPAPEGLAVTRWLKQQWCTLRDHAGIDNSWHCKRCGAKVNVASVSPTKPWPRDETSSDSICHESDNATT